MSLMCPMSGCKGQKGMCLHEKVMGVVIIVVVLYFIFQAVR